MKTKQEERRWGEAGSGATPELRAMIAAAQRARGTPEGRAMTADALGRAVAVGNRERARKARALRRQSVVAGVVALLGGLAFWLNWSLPGGLRTAMTGPDAGQGRAQEARPIGPRLGATSTPEERGELAAGADGGPVAPDGPGPVADAGPAGIQVDPSARPDGSTTGAGPDVPRPRPTPAPRLATSSRPAMPRPAPLPAPPQEPPRPYLVTPF